MSTFRRDRNAEFLTRMNIRLIVIRTADMQRLVAFYELLGLNWEYHRHGESPFHYSTEVNETVLEIYPLAKEQVGADKNLRLGFGIERFEETMMLLKEKGVRFFSEPREADFGFSAIVIDPDGRKIELYKV